MKSPQPYVIVILALTTLGGAGIAWSQYRELIELRAAAMDPNERADWQKRAWDLESRNRELQDELAASRPPSGDATPHPTFAEGADRPDPTRDRGGQRGGRGPQQQMAAVRDLMAKPEVQALMRIQQTAAIDVRYAALFHRLNLGTAQADQLKNFLAERQTTLQDVLMAARDQGVNPRTDPEGFRKLIADAQGEVDVGIKSLLGDSGFAQLQNYEQTLPQRTLVNDLQQRLSYTPVPLSAAQADQLVQILADNPPPRGENANPPPPGRGFIGPELGGLVAGALGGPGMLNAVGDMGARGGGTARVTAGAVTQAQTVLAPTQMSALQQIQQQQQSQQQLQQLLRDNLSPGGSAPATRRKGGG